MLRLDEGGYNYKGYVIYRDYDCGMYRISGNSEFEKNCFSQWVDAEQFIDEMEEENE